MPPPAPALATEGPGAVRAAGRGPLLGTYLLYFGGIGIALPFLPQWFRAQGRSGLEIGLLLGLQPALALIVPPLWGALADRTGRPDRVLSAISLGMAAGFAPLAFVDGFVPMVLAMAVYAFFACSVTTVLDSIALHRVALLGGTYARVRLFGSLGFVLTSTAFGLGVSRVDRRVVFAALACMVAFFLWSLTLRARAAVSATRRPLAGLRLLRDRELALVLAASALHWIAGAAFHGMFGVHVTALGLPPWVIGVSAGLGVAAEIAVMFVYPRVSERFSPRQILFVAFAGSAARWAGMALTDDAGTIVALSLLHGLSFGAFYVAAVAFVAGRVPEGLRATGQALFVSVTFGLGGLSGFLLAGAGYEALGGHRLFALAALAEVLPALGVLLVRPRPAPGSP